MKITKARVRYIAELAHLALSEEEEARYAAQLEKILDYVEQLDSVETEGLPATAHPFARPTPLRPDRPGRGLDREAALRCAPARNRTSFLVPRVIEAEDHREPPVEIVPEDDTFEPVIGLEVHCQLKTTTKIFCGCAPHFGAEPNTHICPVCLGMPGALPVLNEEAVRLAVKAALALSCRIERESLFARKNYFYPDLPKGYQISQYRRPLATGGRLVIETERGEKEIGITRIHLEEDAGKSIHEGGEGTALDFNRAGVPLIEIVSEPDLSTPEEAVAYLKELHAIVVELGICEGNMEEGNFRCDANVSLRRKGTSTFGVRTELKNLNSFRFIQRALEYEIARQRARLSRGEAVVQETRLYDPDRDQTFPMRGKEEAHDYRYFPDPDLLPLTLAPEWIDEIGATLPELPGERRKRLITTFHLSRQEAAALVGREGMADFFEATVALGAPPRATCNWLLGDVLKSLNRRGETIRQAPITPEALAELIELVEGETISGKQGKMVLERIFEGRGQPRSIVAAEGMAQISDTAELTRIIEAVIAAHPEPVADYRAGNTKILAFFVGQVMKATKGKANPKRVNELLKRLLQA